APVDPGPHERAVVELLVEEHVDHRQQQRALGSGVRRQPLVGLRRRVREARIDHDHGRAVGLALDDPLRMRVEVVAGLEMRREQQDRLRVGVVGRRPIVAAPEKVAQPRPRGADVGVAVVTVDAPRLQDAVGVTIFAGTADVVHDFVPPAFDDRRADLRRHLVQRFVPRHLLPSAAAALAVALQRIQDAIRIFELVRRDDALGAGAAAAARVNGIAFDFADGEALLVDVGEDAARRLTVETDARNDPVAAPFLLRPALRLVIDVVVPRRWIRMRTELRISHESGTLWPAATQMYSHAKLPASASRAARASTGVTAVPAIATTIAAAAMPIAPNQKVRAKAPRRMAAVASSWWRVGLRISRCSALTIAR